MRQISATMFIPFEFANLQKKIRFVAIVHPKTHAPPTALSFKTHTPPLPHTNKTSSLYFLMYFFCEMQRRIVKNT